MILSSIIINEMKNVVKSFFLYFILFRNPSFMVLVESTFYQFIHTFKSFQILIMHSFLSFIIIITINIVIWRDKRELCQREQK
jgi:hypothetical protein